MTLTQLAHLLEAHKAGSFSRAARTCGVTQAALSSSIAKLEEELGERIFSRTTRRVCLSPFGETLIPYVEQILNGRDALLGAAKAQQAPTTTVIGHSPLIPSSVLTQILADLLQRLGEHTLDIALIPDGEYASAIRSASVAEDPLYYVPRRGLDSKAAEVEVKSLAADTFVMVPDRCGLARTTRALFVAAGVQLQVYAGEAMGYHVLQEWAALGLGSAIIPRSRLKEGTAAIPVMRAPSVPAVLTYRVAWHSEYVRGKQLAALLQPFRPDARATPASPRVASGDARRPRGDHLRRVR
jgi:LysR family hydrogen peroxide-inducible transcriptional activator